MVKIRDEERTTQLAAHHQTAAYHESTLQIAKALRLARLRVKALQLGLHVPMCQRHSCVYQ